MAVAFGSVCACGRPCGFVVLSGLFGLRVGVSCAVCGSFGGVLLEQRECCGILWESFETGIAVLLGDVSLVTGGSKIDALEGSRKACSLPLAGVAFVNRFRLTGLRPAIVLKSTRVGLTRLIPNGVVASFVVVGCLPSRSSSLSLPASLRLRFGAVGVLTTVNRFVGVWTGDFGGDTGMSERSMSMVLDGQWRFGEARR